MKWNAHSIRNHSLQKETWASLAVLNALNLEGKLTKEQAAFMADHKPAEELYDIEKDPNEVHNLATDPAYAKVKAELAKALADWRKSINDQDPTPEFKAGGWPATYPTRSKEDWVAIMKAWEPYVFRKPGTKVKGPSKLIRKTDPVKKPKKSKKTKKD